MPDAITIVIPTFNVAPTVAVRLREWAAALVRLDREFTILVVDDGSTDGTAAAVEMLTAKLSTLMLLRHDTHRGFGACLRTALPTAQHPLLAYTSLDYPYTPSDLGRLLARLDVPTDVYGVMKNIEAVSGCRTGRATPRGWRIVGRTYRVLCRIALGFTPEPSPTWLGWRTHIRGWALWLGMGVPLVDVDSALKIFRRSVFDRFPLQSDGDFVHAEIFAKLTFLTVLVTEEKLTAKPDPIPAANWHDFRRVFRDAKFDPRPTSAVA